MIIFLIVGASFGVHAEPPEMTCAVRSGVALNCQIKGKHTKSMDAGEVLGFVDAGEASAFLTVKSMKGIERTFLLDARAPQLSRLAELKRSATASTLAKAKADAFSDIEKKVVKVSNELDQVLSTADLVQWDPGVVSERYNREIRKVPGEPEASRKKSEKGCGQTAARLQLALNALAEAFQTPNTCLSSYKFLAAKDGVIDVRQFDAVADQYKQNCHR